MVIVSQDRTMMINFENIEVIGIGNPLEDNDGKFRILVDTTSDNQYTIANYNTEEEAKKILKDLILRYEAIELKKTDSTEKEGYTLSDYTPVYEMPKE